MSNFNSPRYQRWFVQQQAALLAFNNSAGTWTNTGAQTIRVDAGSVTVTRNAPYSRLPVLTGTKSEVAGVRGRKLAAWDIRGLPLIPSGVAGTIPDIDIILQGIFGQPATIVAATSATYSFLDSGYLPFSLFGWVHGFTSLTSRALWGCFVSRMTINFNGLFLTADLSGFAGYEIDSTGFSIFDTQAKAGLTTYPIEPVSPTTNGQPIAGFGAGYNCTLDSQDLSLKTRVASITIETGFTPVADVLGSPYMIASVGDARRVSINVTALDDDTAALNDLKVKADTDNTTITASILSGNVAGSKMTCTLNAIQPNAFNIRDSGAMTDMELPTSYAHATAVGNVDDMTMQFS